MNRDLFFQAANARALGQGRVPQVWSVSQVNALARELLEGSVPLLRVAGEISGFKRYRSGHCFFTLKDDRAQLGCVMWRDHARALPTEPPEGMAVHVLGHPSIYERAGRFQFVVREVDARGEGLWRLAFERIRSKLEADGLLDPARKRPLPRFPDCVGVITSAEGAVLRDIVSVIRRRAPWTDIVLYPTRVQGEDAPRSILAALRYACRARHADVLILGRGGGSQEDMRAFNDERVARAIAAATTPVISAVGHETDVTLADLVADRRAATPSAAAECAVPDAEGVRADLRRAAERLATSLHSGLQRAALRTQALERRLISALERGLADRRSRLDGLAQQLAALGPLAVLQRGYAVALDGDGHVLRSVNDFSPGGAFELRLTDGRVRARAAETLPER